MKSDKVVIFDVYKTLIDIKTDEKDIRVYEALSKWLLKRGVEASAGQLRKDFRGFVKEEICLSKEKYPDVEIGEIFSRIIARYAGREAGNNIKLIEETAAAFRALTTSRLSIYPDVITVLKRLRKKVKLAIVSNAQRLFTTRELEKYGLLKYFDYVLFSSDVKACKPSPKIFRRALKNLKIAPRNAVYVGDDPFNDVEGAHNAGMKTIWIDHGTSLLNHKMAGIPDAIVKTADYKVIPGIAARLLEQ
jgi:putative hydrolase of the HAD superfamily